MRARVVFAMCLGAAIALSGAVAAAAATPDDGTYVVTYAGTVTTVTTNPDGVDKQTVETGPIVVSCTIELCQVTETPLGFYSEVMSFPPGSPPVAKALPGATSVCDNTQAAAGDLSAMEATATAFTTTFVAPSPGWEECSDGRKYRHAMTINWVGTTPTGDLCIFEETHCAPTPTPTPTPTAVIITEPLIDPEPASAGSSLLWTGDPAAPSSLSTLATPATAGTAPSQLILAAVLTVILVLLVAFPTSLLNSAVDAGGERLSGWWSARRATQTETPTSVATEALARSRFRATWWWAAIGVAAASVISAFVDPSFGFNAGSARVLLSILVSFAVDVALGWLLVIWLVRRLAPGATHSFVFRPLTLLVVLVAVVFSRVTGFEPGIVFGLVAGVAFAALVGRAQQARASLATLGYAFAIALVAWILYGLVGGGATAGDSFWQTFAIETLASIAIGGMAALPIALFPVRGLPGHTIWSWNRRVWAGCYALGLFAFFIVLMPMPFSWEGVSWDLWAWIGLYLVYAVVAVVSWLLATRPWRRGEQSDEQAAQSAEERSAEEPAEKADIGSIE